MNYDDRIIMESMRDQLGAILDILVEWNAEYKKMNAPNKCQICGDVVPRFEFPYRCDKHPLTTSTVEK